MTTAVRRKTTRLKTKQHTAIHFHNTGVKHGFVTMAERKKKNKTKELRYNGFFLFFFLRTLKRTGLANSRSSSCCAILITISGVCFMAVTLFFGNHLTANILCLNNIIKRPVRGIGYRVKLALSLSEYKSIYLTSGIIEIAPVLDPRHVHGIKRLYYCESSGVGGKGRVEMRNLVYCHDYLGREGVLN